MKRYPRLLPIFFVFSVFLAACALGQDARGKKASPDWSRALPLEGMPVGGMGLAPGEGGLHVVWPEREGNETRVRYTRLDFPAEVGDSRLLDVGKEVPRYLRLLPLNGGRYALLWASRLPGTGPWGLRALLLDSGGQPQGSVFPLLPPERGVARFDAVSLPDGEVFLVWSQNAPGGVFAARWNPATGVLSLPERLAAEGEAPAAQVGRDGVVYLAWRSGQDIWYAALGADGASVEPPAVVARTPAGTGASVSPVAIGLSKGRVYLFWAVLSRSGMEAGTGYTACVSFPRGEARRGVPQRVLISAAEELPYRPADAWTGISTLAPPVPQAAGSDFILSPAVPRGEQDVMLLALSVRQAYRLDAYQQIALGLLRDGVFEGYAFVTRSQQLSDEPHIALDEQGYAHLLWREGAFGQRVFYATNEPEARAQLDALTPADFLNALLEGGLESLTSMLLLPIIGFGWLLPGLALLGVWKLARDDESIHKWASRFVLAVALGVYQAVKWVSLPSMAVYVPFSAWLDVPPAWHTPLQIGVPLFALLAGIVVASRTARRKNPSTVLFYLVVGLVDALLTLAVYGVILLGAY